MYFTSKPAIFGSYKRADRSLLKFLILFVLIFCWKNRLLAQKEVCGFDPIYKMQMRDPLSRARIESINSGISEMQTSIQKMQEIGKNLEIISGAGGQYYQIPVVVHVIHRGEAVGSVGNPDDAAIQSMINFLNQVYAGTNVSGGVSTPVRFTLAKRTPDCQSTNGIIRINAGSNAAYGTDGVHMGQFGKGMAEADLKALSRWPPEEYYNIWVAWKIFNPNAGYVTNGFAYYPGSGDLDGTVLAGNAVNNSSLTLAHEMGHAMGLFHTFQSTGGDDVCAVNNNCSSDGDQICDTDPHTQEFGCPGSASINTCTGKNWGMLPRNIMGYFGCRDRFTNGQASRLLATLLNQRYSLVASLGGTPPWNPQNALYIPVQTATNNPSVGTGIGPVKVVLNDIFYESSGYNSSTSAAYIDKTCMVGTTLNTLRDATLEITTTGSYRQIVKVWLNLNDNNTFEPNELIATSTTPAGVTGAYTHSIYIPAYQFYGATTARPLRLRVAADYFANPNFSFNSKLDYGQMKDFTVVLEGAGVALPVNFGSVSAFLNHDQLQVNWESISEINNDRYEVQLSKDGKAFYTIGSQLSQARNGNSDTSIEYKFSMDNNAISGFLAGLFVIGLIPIRLCRKGKLLNGISIASVLILFSLLGNSCNKDFQDAGVPTSELFVRIAQIDKKGSIQYSKVVKVINQ